MADGKLTLSNEAADEWAETLMQQVSTADVSMKWLIAMALQEAHSRGFSLAVDEMERRLLQQEAVR